MWDHLAGDLFAYARISRALGEFYLSPYSNNGYDGPPDIDQDEAVATYYTANCVTHGIVDFAHLLHGLGLLASTDRVACDRRPHPSRGRSLFA